MRRATLLTSTLLLALFVVGAEEQAKVDRNYIGDWEAKDGDKTMSLIIRNLDDKNYYVELTEDNKTSRYTAFIGAVKDAQFANLRELTDDGTIQDERLIMRVGLKDGKLELRNLKDEFFKDQTVDSQAQLTSLIEKNLENKDLYEESVVLTRAVSK